VRHDEIPNPPADFPHHGEFHKECPTGEVLARLDTTMSEDVRKWSIKCSNARGVKLVDCSWHDQGPSYKIGREWALGNKHYDVIVGMGARTQASETIYKVKTCRVVGAKIINVVPDPRPMTYHGLFGTHGNFYWPFTEDFVVRIESQHPNSNPNFEWYFTSVVMCTEEAPQCAEMLEHSGDPADSAGITTKHHTAFKKECPLGEVLTSIYSEHSAKEKDRNFSFSCGVAPGLKLTDCAWTIEDSKHLAEEEWTLGNGERVIVGLRSSTFSNDKQDRTYSIKSCKVNGTDMPQSVSATSWANEYRGTLSYNMQHTSFMTKIVSTYSELHRDRKFKFATVQLCVAGTDVPTGNIFVPETFEETLALWESSIHSKEHIVNHMKTDMTRVEIPWVTFSDFADWNFSSRALLIPNHADKQLVLNFESEVKIQDYVMAGGTLIVCGGGDFYTPYRGISLLNRIFGLGISKGPKNSYHYGTGLTAKRNEPGCGIFCSAGNLKDMPWTTMTVSTENLPATALIAYKFEDEANRASTPVFTLPYHKGLIVYLGFDWWQNEEEKRQPWADLLKLAFHGQA